VKKVIHVNLNLLTAKNESLKDTAVDEVRNDLGWTVAGKGRKKESLQLTLRGAQPIPVIRNHLEPHDNLMNHELDTFNLIMPLQGTEPMQTKTELRTGKNIKYQSQETAIQEIWLQNYNITWTRILVYMV
jgi:hypothetical protein